MKVSLTDSKIRDSVKFLLKKYHLKYADLSLHLQLSIPGVKQMMTKGTFTTDKIERIAQFFDMSFFEFIELCHKTEITVKVFTEPEESALTKDPLAIRLLILLGTGMSFEQVANRLKHFDSKKIQKSLLTLDKLDLIEFIGASTVKIKRRGPYKFRLDGSLSKKYHTHYLSIISSILQKKNKQNDHLNHCFELYLAQESAKNMAFEAKNLIKKYLNLSSLETRTKPEDKLEAISCAFLVSEYDGWGETLDSFLTL